ncbi:XK-related protein 5a [Alosa sapidissima]|uniref:XK-related protein 5a n=1 Tax=Alosa sapidissima TaxID=34773 RepID=UPI001C093F68|nr:XK-related protein 5a [Alosa sapidissima]
MISEEFVAGAMAPAVRRGCWTAWCQVILFAVSALVIVAERTALLYCVGYYLWVGERLWAAWTLALLLPGALVQVLSCWWYLADGERRRCLLALTHLLHLGIFKRFWDCMSSVWHMQGSAGQLGVAVMQQADVAGLRLLEALLVTLPQTLLQTYVLVATDMGLTSPVSLCCGTCLFSLSWALVLFSRACCLIRPGHLAMPPAALLCQLLWRAGMLGARVASLMFFTRVFGWWVCGVIGFHWVTAAFWLMSQQTDICSGPWRWRVFNGTLAVVHVFCFLNVKDGPSRFRMAGFYLVMFLENATLMLAASDFLNEASWDSLTVPTAVLCSFLSGLTSLVLYYRFLHPKSTEISLGLQHMGAGSHMGSTCLDLERGESSFSLGGDKSLRADPSSLHLASHPSFSLSGMAGSLLEPPANCVGGKGGGGWGYGGCRHHHWLLVRLALKTGDPGRINRAYGAGGVAAMLGVVAYPPGLMGADGGVMEGGMLGKGRGEEEEEEGAREEDQALAPLSDCKEEFQSASEDEPTSRVDSAGLAGLDGDDDDDDDDEESLPMESPLESPGSDCKRSSPEGKSVLGDSPEPRYCPTESSSTLYFSADPQSPSSASNPRLDRDTTAFGFGAESLAELSSPVDSERGASAGPSLTGPLGRLGPCYSSTPRLDGPHSAAGLGVGVGTGAGVGGETSFGIPHLSGPRRQLVLSRRGLEEDAGF